MVVDRIVVGPIQCNCYVVADETSRKAYLIDPGAESGELLSYLRSSRWDLEAILITHCHVDHIGGINSVTTQHAAPIWFHPGDQFLFDDVAMQARLFGVTPGYLQASQPSEHHGTLQDGDLFPFSRGAIRAIHTPGHTPGSTCYFLEGTVFTGDTLFQGSIGRTDLWGGSFPQIMESIKTRLTGLGDDVRVLPGHGEETTIGEERRSNPFLLNY